MTSAARRRAVVTGAARGIGRAIAERLLDDGFDIIVVDRSDDVLSVADELSAPAAADRGCAEPAVIDLAATDADARLRALAADHAVDVIVNNAGIFDKTPILDIDVDAWDRVQQINTTSMLLTMQAFVPGMIDRRRGGRIVNIASMAAKRGTAGEAAYAASKAAVVALSRIASIEFGRHSITVNSICPGYVLTEMGADTRDQAQICEWTAQSPLGRLAAPGDVAAAVSHLVSDEASYITGEAINVSGGMCTW